MPKLNSYFLFLILFHKKSYYNFKFWKRFSDYVDNVTFTNINNTFIATCLKYLIYELVCNNFNNIINDFFYKNFLNKKINDIFESKSD